MNKLYFLSFLPKFYIVGINDFPLCFVFGILNHIDRILLYRKECIGYTEILGHFT